MLSKFIAFAIIIVIAASCSKEEVVDYSATDKKIIENYLVAHNLTAQSTASGLYYIIQKPGGANHPDINSIVSVNYQGFLTDDSTFFDSSYPQGKPMTSALNTLIKGWKEGLPLIGVNGKIQLFVPSALGYGSAAAGIIPANSVILFKIELVDFY